MFCTILIKSDHFQVCFTRKNNCKIARKKKQHISVSYKCFKSFDEQSFLYDLENELIEFLPSRSDFDDDIATWNAYNKAAE